MVKNGGIAGENLRSYVKRIEILEEEKRGIAEDIKEVYASAKSTGLDVKILRKVVQIRKMDQAERMEQEALLDVYLHALEGGDMPEKTSFTVSVSQTANPETKSDVDERDTTASHSIAAE